MLGSTEYVFTSKDKLFPDPPKERRMSLRDMLEGSTSVASIRQPVGKCYEKKKRVADKSAPETGPPKKIQRICVNERQIDSNTCVAKGNLFIIFHKRTICGKALFMLPEEFGGAYSRRFVRPSVSSVPNFFASKLLSS